MRRRGKIRLCCGRRSETQWYSLKTSTTTLSQKSEALYDRVACKLTRGRKENESNYERSHFLLLPFSNTDALHSGDNVYAHQGRAKISRSSWHSPARGGVKRSCYCAS